MPASADVSIHARGLAEARTPELAGALADGLASVPESLALVEAWLELSRALELEPDEAFDRVLGEEVTLYAREGGEWALLTRIDRDVESRVRERLRPALRGSMLGFPVLAVGAGRVEIVPIPDPSGVVLLVAPAASRSLARDVLGARADRRGAPALDSRATHLAASDAAPDALAEVRLARVIRASDERSPPLASVFVRGAGRPMLAEVRAVPGGLNLRAAMHAPNQRAPRRSLDAQALLVLSSLERDPSCVLAIATRGDAYARLAPRLRPDDLRLMDGRVVERLMGGWSAWSGPLMLACVELPRGGRGAGAADPVRAMAFACWADTLDDEWVGAFSEWIASSAQLTLWPRAAGPRPRVEVGEHAGLRVATIEDRGVWGARPAGDPRSRGRRSVAWELVPAPTSREAWWFGSIEAAAEDASCPPAGALWAREHLARALAWTTPHVAAESGVLMRGFMQPGPFMDGFIASDARVRLARAFERIEWDVTQAREGALRLEARATFSTARDDAR